MVIYLWLKTKWHILVAFAKWPATAVLVISALPTVCDLGSPRLVPDGFLLNFMSSTLNKISPHGSVFGYDRPELRGTSREVLRWLTGFSSERGEAVFSMRYDLNISCIAGKMTGKAISRRLRYKHRKKQCMDIYKTRARNKSERPKKQLMP